jgi:para-nitrobenzyl esterase
MLTRQSPMRTPLWPLCGAALALLLVAGCGSSAPCEGAACAAGGSGGSGGEVADPLVVTTDRGPVRGLLVNTTHAFRKIPFAAPPVGELRWKPPAPHAAWTTTLDATKKGPRCVQRSLISGELDAESDEDCLTVNVWAPAVAPPKPAPVLVWIHGGTFMTGSGGDLDYDGRKLSEATGSVVVTLNYRLGPLGYLAYSPLAKEDAAHPGTGMYGFEDQRAALAWVKANITAFGGDAGNVSLFGESAGGISACLHLVSPKSEGLFQRILLESGPCVVNLGPTAPAAKAQGDAFAAALGCADVACLRGKTAKEVLFALPPRVDFVGTKGAGWFPTVDGVDVPMDPAQAFATGQFTKVPTLLGTNANEGSLFFLGNTAVATDADFVSLMERFFPGHGAEILARYPSSTFGTPVAAASVAFGEGALMCPSRRLTRTLAGAGVPTYLYDFRRAPDSGKSLGLGAYHSSEVQFVFGNPTTLSDSLTDAEKKLSAEMMGDWGRMARSGDPNGSGAFAWPKFDLAKETTLVLDLEVHTEVDVHKDACDFWDKLTPATK